jgi:hypothetical protein
MKRKQNGQNFHGIKEAGFVCETPQLKYELIAKMLSFTTVVL